jgi:hypothetical protein
MDDAELLMFLTRKTLERVSVIEPCTVLDYQRAAGTVKVKGLVCQPIEQRDGSVIQNGCPAKGSVPILWPSLGNGAMITGPIQRGDRGWLVFPHKSLDEFTAGALSQAALAAPRDDTHVEPGSSRKFSLADVRYLPAWADAGQPLPANATHETDVVFRLPNGRSLRFGDSTAAEALALARLVFEQLQAIQAAFNGHTHTITGQPVVGATPATPGGPVTVTGVTVGPSTTYTAQQVASQRLFTTG